MEDRNEYPVYAENEERTENDFTEEDEQEETTPLSLEEFLADNPISDETGEVVICERLKNFAFKIGLMTKEQRTTYINACMIKDRKGHVLKQDMGKFNELVVLNHCLYPNFKSLDFVKKCGCNTPAEALFKTLKVGEVERLSQKIMEFNGFDDFEDLRKQAKN